MTRVVCKSWCAKASPWQRSLRGNPRFLDDARPLHHLDLEKSGVSLRRVQRKIPALCEQCVAYIRLLNEAVKRLVQSLDDIARHARRIITFRDGMTLHVGDHTFEMIHMPGHTAYQAAICIKEEGVTFTSDNIFHKVQTWLQEANPDLWLVALEGLRKLPEEIFVPGHGDVCGKGVPAALFMAVTGLEQIAEWGVPAVAARLTAADLSW